MEGSEAVRAHGSAALALVVAALGLTACGSDPASLAGPEEAASVAGNWVYAAPDLEGDFFGDPVTCDYNLRMRIANTGPQFSGTYSDALLVCNLFGQPQIVDAGSGRIVGGTLTGSSVQFDFDFETFHNTGTIMGDEMGGYVALQLVVQVNQQVDTIFIRGRWSAPR